MPRPKKNKTSSKQAAKTLAVKQSIHNQQDQIFFDAVDEKVLKALPIIDRIKQLEEQEKICEELQKKAGLEKLSFQEILAKEIDEEMPQAEMTQLKELQDQISFYEELSEDLKKLQTATKELFQALEEDHTNQEELKLLLQKIRLLENVKYFIDADTLFNYVYRLLKEYGVSKKTLQDILKQEKIPQLKTAKMSSTIGDAAEKEEEEQHWGKVFPFTVLGFNNNHEIKISHKGQIKTISITGARQGFLSLYVGINNERNDDQLTEILIGMAHKEGNIDDQNTIKTGIDFLEREKKFLIVSGTSFFKVSPEDLQIEKLQKPVVDGRLV